MSEIRKKYSVLLIASDFWAACVSHDQVSSHTTLYGSKSLSPDLAENAYASQVAPVLKVYLFHSRRQVVHDQPGQYICTATDSEEDVVANEDVADILVVIKYKANKEREQRTSHRASHASDTYHRAYRPFREHVRNSGEDVGTPGLVRRRQADQANSDPDVCCVACSHDRYHQQGNDEHGRFTCLVHRPAFPDEVGGEVATTYTANGSGRIHDHEGQARLA